MKRLSIVVVLGALIAALIPPSVATAMVSPSPFEVRRDGNTYHAESQTTSSSYSGSLKSVVESATDELDQHGGGVVRFLAGDFNLGPDWFEFFDLTDIVFEGAGIDVTILRNNASASTDTEPFDFTRSDRITVRDMTVDADGPPRNTSDALDFDGGDDVVVERVKVTSARGRGIIFDGKDSGQTALRNVVRDCIITGVQQDGIQLLASSQNRIENCTITNVGGEGIRITKSSTSADQPNKQSTDNLIIGNTIEFTSSHGIGLKSAARNHVLGNTVLNSQGRSGIYLNSSNGVNCNDNIIEGNVSGDDQPLPTQEWGLNISDTECNRTVVAGNTFFGNTRGDVNDNGTNTIFTSTDTQPPSAPANLIATNVTGAEVAMDWDPSSDNIGVVAYDIYRNGGLYDTVGGATTAYTDSSVAPQTDYDYFVRARDAAGNSSNPSNTLSVTTGSAPPIVTLAPTDDATLRPNRGVLGANPTLEVDASSVKDSVLRFDANVAGSSTVVSASLRLHAVDGSSNGGAFVEMMDTNWSEATITWENAPPGDGLPLGSLGSVSPGNWYEIDVTAVVAGSGPVAFRISSSNPNGADYVSKEGASALAPQLVVELDDGGPPDDEPPTAPTNLTATDVQATTVALSWQPASDNVGVIAYDVYRDGGFLDTVGGASTNFVDVSVAPDTSYAYIVRARDAAGNVSPPSNTVTVTTPGQPAVITLTPTDDATIRENRPNRNLGSDTAIEVDASSVKDALLRFDVSGVGPASVLSATLRLYVVNGSSSGGDWRSMTNTNWSEDTVTWNTAPAGDGAFLTSVGSVSVGTWIEIDVTTLVSGDGPFSLRGSSSSPNGADYTSKEGGGGFAPQLVIVLG